MSGPIDMPIRKHIYLQDYNPPGWEHLVKGFVVSWCGYVCKPERTVTIHTMSGEVVCKRCVSQPGALHERL